MDSATTVEQQMRAALPGLTPAERQLASHILGNYPVAALGSITTVAQAAGVSTPTVVRLVQKLGFRGYPDCQAAIRAEVEAMLQSPIARHGRHAATGPGAPLLDRFAEAAIGNLRATLGQIDPAEFDAVATLLADPARQVFALGGRITHVFADYFSTLMQAVRPSVRPMLDNPATWPPAMLDLRPGDVVLVFDIRRYETMVLQAAELAAEQGAEVVLITDRWISPAAAHARHVLSCHVEAPSAWDSTVALLAVVETLLAEVQARTWDRAEPRLRRLEALFERSRLFRRPR